MDHDRLTSLLEDILSKSAILTDLSKDSTVQLSDVLGEINALALEALKELGEL